MRGDRLRLRWRWELARLRDAIDRGQKIRNKMFGCMGGAAIFVTGGGIPSWSMSVGGAQSPSFRCQEHDKSLPIRAWPGTKTSTTNLEIDSYKHACYCILRLFTYNLLYQFILRFPLVIMSSVVPHDSLLSKYS